MNTSGIHPNLSTTNTPSMANDSPQPASDGGDKSLVAFLADVDFKLWQVGPPVLLLLGCYGNIMTIVIMRGMRTAQSTACLSVYFTALAVSDLFLLASSQLWYWPKLVFDMPLSYFNNTSCRILFYTFYVTSTTSAWFLVAMTCQRMISVVWPHRVAVLCTVRRGKIVTAAIVTVSCLINTNIFFVYHVIYVDDDYAFCVSVDERLTNIFRVLDLVVASVIPFIILVVANGVLISRAMQSIRLSRRMMSRKEDNPSQTRSARVSSMTTTLILTSVAFLVLTLPTCVLDVYLDMVGYYVQEVVDEVLDAKLTLVDTVFNLMWASNSAVNFYIYVLSGRKFREETKRVLCQPCRAQRSSSSSSSSSNTGQTA